MKSRHARRASISPKGKARSEAPGEAESGTRIKRAAAHEDLKVTVTASLDAALDALDHLELTDEQAAKTPLAPAQRMPKGMPPLPFGPNLPKNMPPLPKTSAPKSLSPPKKSPRRP
jgi:hypothetical protein